MQSFRCKCQPSLLVHRTSSNAAFFHQLHTDKSSGTARSSPSTTSLIATSTSTPSSPISSRSTRRASGCPLSILPPSRLPPLLSAYSLRSVHSTDTAWAVHQEEIVPQDEDDNSSQDSSTANRHKRKDRWAWATMSMRAIALATKET